MDSVLSQTFNDYEVICIDDNSSDRTFDILGEYSKKDLRIAVFKNEKNLKAGKTRNRGIELSKGEFILFLDADDWLVPEALEKMLALSEPQKLDMLMFQANCYSEVKKRMTDVDYYLLSNLKNLPEKVVYQWKKGIPLLFTCVVPWNKLYRKDFLNLQKLRFPEDVYYEDTPFFYETYLKAKKIAILREKLVVHRIDLSSSMTGSKGEKVFDFFRIYDLIEAIIKEEKIWSSVDIEFYIYKISLLRQWQFEITDPDIQKKYRARLKEEFVKMNLNCDQLYQIKKKNSTLSKFYKENSSQFFFYALRGKLKRKIFFKTRKNNVQKKYFFGICYSQKKM